MFQSISDIKRANVALGQHWFDADAMEFFNTRIVLGIDTTADSGIIDGRYFITADRMDLSDPERFTIRYANSDGKVGTVDLPHGRDGFRAYPTAEAARKAAMRLL